MLVIDEGEPQSFPKAKSHEDSSNLLRAMHDKTDSLQKKKNKLKPMSSKIETKHNYRVKWLSYICTNTLNYAFKTIHFALKSISFIIILSCQIVIIVKEFWASVKEILVMLFILINSHELPTKFIYLIFFSCRFRFWKATNIEKAKDINAWLQWTRESQPSIFKITYFA